MARNIHYRIDPPTARKDAKVRSMLQSLHEALISGKYGWRVSPNVEVAPDTRTPFSAKDYLDKQSTAIRTNPSSLYGPSPLGYNEYFGNFATINDMPELDTITSSDPYKQDFSYLDYMAAVDGFGPYAPVKTSPLTEKLGYVPPNFGIEEKPGVGPEAINSLLGVLSDYSSNLDVRNPKGLPKIGSFDEPMANAMGGTKKGRRPSTVAEVIASEARSLEDFEMIASVIANRANLAGVPVEDVVIPDQFDALNRSIPKGVTEKDIARAQATLDKVLKEGVPPQYADAIGYARDYAVDNMPPGWEPTGVVTPDKHVVFSDPAGGWIATTGGYVEPKPQNIAGFQVDTASPFGPDPDHPATPGWLSGPVDATPVQIDDFSQPAASPLGGGLQDVADVTKGLPTTSASDFLAARTDKPRSHISGMDPDLRGRLAAMFEAAPPDIAAGLGIYSGARSLERQRELYDASDKTGRWVARPSPNAPHVKGIAADLSYYGQSLKHAPKSVRDWVRENAPTFGLSLPMSYEPWHVETIEARNPNPNIPASGWPSDVATPMARPDLVPPGMEVEQAPLGSPIETAQALPSLADTVQPSPAEFAPASLASMLSPISSAQAAESIPASVTGPLDDSFVQSPLSDYDTITGTDITDTPAGIAALNVRPETPSFAQTNDIIDRLSPLSDYGVAPQVSTAEQVSGIPASVTGPLDDSYIQSPLASPTISPLSDYETIVGKDVTPTSLPSMGLYGGLLGAPMGLQPPGVGPLQPSGFVSPVPAEQPVQDVVSPVSPVKTVDVPSLSRPPAQPTVDDSSIYGTPSTMDDFPAAPDISNWDKFANVAGPIAKNASLGNTIAGPFGALAGGIYGALPAIGVDLGLGPQFDNVVPDSQRFSTGFGLEGIMGAMGGPFGAQGFSLSNPGMSFTSFGDRVGTGGVGLRRSDKYGWTEVVGPDGAVRGIHFDDPSGGGIFGSLSRAMGDKFGGGFSEKEKSDFSGKAGLW